MGTPIVSRRRSAAPRDLAARGWSPLAAATRPKALKGNGDAVGVAHLGGRDEPIAVQGGSAGQLVACLVHPADADEGPRRGPTVADLLEQQEAALEQVAGAFVVTGVSSSSRLRASSRSW